MGEAGGGEGYPGGVPNYDFRCRRCGDTFEVNRPMAQASDPATCPQGHDDTVKLLSTVAIGGSSAAPPPSGGCCGGGCGCG